MAELKLALTVDGRLTYCKAPPEKMGKGRCNHVAHQAPGETSEQFIARVSEQICDDTTNTEKEDSKPIAENPINDEEIMKLRNKIYEICGTEDVNIDNFMDIYKDLPLEKQQELTEIGFENSQYFAFPITDENYEEQSIRTNIYFGNMGDFGIGAKQRHVNEILGEIGSTVGSKGELSINGNYKDGLTEEQWWDLQYCTRVASVNKTVSIAAPGAAARNLFYGLSDTLLIDDCQNDESTGILTCHAPGGICEKCARKSGMGQALDTLKAGSYDGSINGVRVGGLISTNLSEPLTQSYLDAIHSANDPKANQHKVIVATYDCHSYSPIIKKAIEETTTEGRRKALADGLKEAYKDQGIAIDDYNIEIIAKKMTSYKRGANGLEYVEDGDLCDIVSIRSIGNRGNIFKRASLGSSYNLLSKGGETTTTSFDAFNDLNV